MYFLGVFKNEVHIFVMFVSGGTVKSSICTVSLPTHDFRIFGPMTKAFRE